MINLSSALLSSLLASAAFAQPRSGALAPTPGARAWAGPLAAVAAEIGAAGINQLDTLSMPRLTAPDANGRVPMLTSPELLNPLAQTLAESFVDPVEFPSMPMEFKATILRNAAVLTEERLNMAVWSVVLDTNKGIGRSQFAEVSRKTREARATSLYLNDRTMEGLKMLEQRVVDHIRRREEAARAFVDHLPGLLEGGAFDGQSVLRKENDGDRSVWTTADGRPDAAFLTPEDALESRIEAVDRVAPGPWTTADAKLLHSSLHDSMLKEIITPSRWTNSAYERLWRLEKSGAAAVNARLLDSGARVTAGTARLSDVLAVEKFYRDGFASTENDWRMRARVLATVRAGAAGLPSWKSLLERRRALLAATENRGNRAIFGSITALLLIFFLVKAGLSEILPLAAPAALLALSTLAFPYILVQRLRRNALGKMEDEPSELELAQDRHFDIESGPSRRP